MFRAIRVSDVYRFHLLTAINSNFYEFDAIQRLNSVSCLVLFNSPLYVKSMCKILVSVLDGTYK